MRFLVAFLLFLGVAILGGYIFLKGYPYRTYSHWIEGKSWDKYYSITDYKPLYLKPAPLDEIPSYVEDYVQLWKEFPLRNSLVPLPVRHPLFITVPIVQFRGKKAAPQIGMSLLSANGRELSRIYTIPTGLYQDYSLGQELFKLPFVRNRILKKDLDSLWKDIFSHEIVVKSKSMDEMIHDLYILHLRSKILPPTTVKYGLIKDGKQAMIELMSADQDYKVELVMTLTGGTIYSYVLRTERVNQESLKLRSKFLDVVNFSPIDVSMGRILYTEFKQLNFARQVDQEGMLYLLSSWSQDIENVDLFKEMIFYLERGQKNSKQLKGLYEYAYKQYGKTFTTRKGGVGIEDGNITLQRSIELEDAERRREAERLKGLPAPEPDLAPDEKMNIYLKKAKEKGPAKTDEMIVH